MSPRRAGIVLALAQAALVAVLGAKLLTDRARFPRAWARTLPIDPDLPIRGRYVRLRLEVPLDSPPDSASPWDIRSVQLRTEHGRVVGTLGNGRGTRVRFDSGPAGLRASLAEPLAYFIPEHVPDPSVRSRGEELWAEVTLPRRGPPRPIRLGVWKEGRLTPLDLR